MLKCVDILYSKRKFNMNLMTLFDQNVKSFPDSPAISMSSLNETWTYSDLHSKVNQISNYLTEFDIKKGDGVLILVPMSLDLYGLLLALFKIGAVAVFIDPQSSKKHIKACINKYPLKAFVGVKKAHLLRIINKSIRKIPVHITMGNLIFTKNYYNFENYNKEFNSNTITQSEDPALITFTSGSTGNPKAVVRTHGFLLTQYKVLSRNMLFDVGEIDMSTLPVFVLANLAAGMHSVIPNVNLLKPAEVNGEILLNDIIKYKATRFGGSPVLVNKIASYIKNDTKNSLTHIYMGGGPVFPNDLNIVQEKFLNSKVYGLYGSTEAEPIAHMSNTDYSSEKRMATQQGKGLFVGKPVSDIIVKIIDSHKLTKSITDLSSIECHIGEIIVSGEHVLKGYLNGEGDSENKIHLNNLIWHRTGDAGYFDDNGYLWLLGRYSQRVESNGQFIYPFAIEAAFYDKGYKTALVKQNNKITLVAENNKPSEDLLKTFNIEHCIVVNMLPRDKRHNAKIDYSELKNILNQSK